MDVAVILDDHVKQRLEDSFGKAVAMMIFASATRTAGVPTADLNSAECRRLIDAICCDQRVLDMWGDTGAEHALADWEKLL